MEFIGQIVDAVNSVLWGWLLLFLLKKFRVPAVVRVPIIFVCLLFYSGVCGFSPSSVRALVMCTVVLATDAAGIGHDKLTNVSLAAIVVLTVNPVHLFSVGFQLSLAAAAGILVLGGELARLLREHTPVPRKIGSALSVSFSAQVATFPVLIDCFGYVQGEHYDDWYSAVRGMTAALLEDGKRKGVRSRRGTRTCG